MTSRNLRIAAALAVAALTLTACGGGGGGTKEKADKAAPTSAATGSTGPASAAPEPVVPTPENPCGGALKVEVRAAKSPAGHALLTATNTSDKICFVDGFPYLRFDQDQATVAPVEESATQDRIAVRPGKAAYAAILTTAADGSGGKGRDVSRLSVTFQAPDRLKLDPLPGAPARPALPDGKLHVDDKVRTTYWMYDEAHAQEWVGPAAKPAM
ncbi:DUF4232 domain-containing protein [Streptomyces cinnamoneus]|uniref:DUF4232 domain-containing protein n=1 Tax=Streptomyces cinnamoneus TaxID=53446 RepID=A0A918TBC0_STRCJ|nr:DUF4232 domain-containing protein [Streptomyces cinnamoneus]GHC37254.1 hypothetical protein GCM10010507_08270 [Streptomyces cinnamoneus]